MQILAAECGVSIVTMSKAVAYLSSEGELEAAPRRGIIAGALTVEQKQTGVFQKTRWHRICTSLRQDITSGLFASSSSLPSLKLLQERYGCSYRPLKRALNYLLERSEIYEYKKSYRLPSVTDISRRGSIITLSYQTMSFVNPGVSLENVSEQDLRHRMVEQHCMKLNITVIPYSFHYKGKSLVLRDRTEGLQFTAAELKDVLAFVVFEQSLPEDFIEQVLSELNKYGKPIIVYDARGLDSSLTEKNKNVSIFRVADNIHCGKTVARYLLQKGHRHLGVFSFAHRQLWARQRLAGIQMAVREFPKPVTVASFLKEADRNIPANDSLNIPLLKQEYSNGLHSSTVRFGPNTTLIKSTLTELVDYFVSRVMFNQLQKSVRKMMKHAMKDPRLTAWIVLSDIVAVFLLRYLRQNKLIPGKDISVISFDDRIAAYFENLTSFNFNENQFIAGMIDYALSPVYKRRQQRVITNTTGYISVRRSVDTPPQNQW